LTKSELRSVAADAHNTRAALVQPSKPNIRNVTSTETKGETFSGISARTVMSKNNQGRDRNKSVTAIDARDHAPPRYPARPPSNAAINVESRAAAGASRREIRVP